MNTKSKAAGILTGFSLILNAVLIVVLTLILTGNGRLIGFEGADASGGGDTRSEISVEEPLVPLETVPAAPGDEGSAEQSSGELIIEEETTTTTAAITTAAEEPFEPTEAETTTTTTTAATQHTAAKTAAPATTRKPAAPKTTAKPTTTTTKKPVSGDNDGNWLPGWH